MKEYHVYWCLICDKMHRKNSKPGKAHYQEYVKRKIPEQKFLEEVQASLSGKSIKGEDKVCLK